MAAILTLGRAVPKGQLWKQQPKPTASGKLLLIAQTRAAKTRSISVPFSFVVYSQHASKVFALDATGQLYCFDLEDNSWQVLDQVNQSPTSMACSSTGDYVFVGTAQGSLWCLWNRHNGREGGGSVVVAGNKGPITSIAVHVKGTHIITTSRGQAILWEVHDHRLTPVRTLGSGQRGAILQSQFIGSDQQVLVILNTNALLRFDFPAFTTLPPLPIPRLERGTNQLGPVAVSSDGTTLVAGAGETTLYVWDLTSCTLRHALDLPARAQAATELKFLPSALFNGPQSNLVAAVCRDGLVRVIHTTTARTVFVVGGIDLEVQNLTCSGSSSHAALITKKGDLWLYDFQPMLPVETLEPRAQKREKGKSVDDSMADDLHLIDLQEPPPFNRRQILAILDAYAIFPAKFRSLIWQALLQVPGNQEAYKELVAKGPHPAYTDLAQRYPLQDTSKTVRLQRLLSRLTHLSPTLGLVRFLPRLVYPFVAVYARNEFALLETVATILANWCRDWFEGASLYPTGPLKRVVGLIEYHDPVLYAHLEACHVPAEVYAGSVLTSGLADVLSAEDWLVLWDHLLCEAPPMLECAVAAYALHIRTMLLKCTSGRDVKALYRSDQPVAMSGLLASTRRIYRACSCASVDDVDRPHITPLLPRGPYPSLARSESDLLVQVAQEKDRIGREEEELMGQRDNHHPLLNYNRSRQETGPLKEKQTGLATSPGQWEHQRVEADRTMARLLAIHRKGPQGLGLYKNGEGEGEREGARDDSMVSKEVYQETVACLQQQLKDEQAQHKAAMLLKDVDFHRELGLLELERSMRGTQVKEGEKRQANLQVLVKEQHNMIKQALDDRELKTMEQQRAEWERVKKEERREMVARETRSRTLQLEMTRHKPQEEESLCRKQEYEDHLTCGLAQEEAAVLQEEMHVRGVLQAIGQQVQRNRALDNDLIHHDLVLQDKLQLQKERLDALNSQIIDLHPP
eukprot:Ihof_evm23s6 gene=Ihof_evmTU23s6